MSMSEGSLKYYWEVMFGKTNSFVFPKQTFPLGTNKYYWWAPPCGAASDHSPIDPVDPVKKFIKDKN